ncbi:MAG: LPS export ABC transporter periplasmic protein LptC [Acetobacter sp.]|nr:LPS export ABC transporter periplasmic protein LptC [Acetobacter sp.]
MNIPSNNRPQRNDFSQKKNPQRHHFFTQSTTHHHPRYNAAYLANRSKTLRRIKWALPFLALFFFMSIIIYPEITAFVNENKTTLKNLSKVPIGDGHLIDVTYRGINAYHCPYTLTADTLYQNKRRNILTLTTPQADILTTNGTWILVHAKQGTYAQKNQILDLTHGVTLYRNDGLMLYSPFADVNLNSGIIASHTWVHAEGPFGTLDAQGYFLSQHDGLAQFRGPGKLIFYGGNKIQ